MRSSLSLNYVRKRAKANMVSTCRIERVQPPVWDSSTNLATPGSRVTVYEGPCRVWEASGSSTVQVGSETIPLQTTQLSIPWDADPVPKRDDEVVMTASATDSSLVGKRFRILDVAKAGDLRPTRRFTISGVQHTGDW